MIAPFESSAGATPNDPVVSVVIPTRGRPELVARAVRSALQQTVADLEVLVIVDGADPATSDALRPTDDPRLRVVELAEPVGGSDARNTGVARARGRWIAFLDDDDEWLPEKLERQLAAESRDAIEIVSCRVLACTPTHTYVWPRRLPRSSEGVSDYLFNRDSVFQGEGLLQTSTLVTPRSLLVAVPFRSGLPRHQDWDWLLRAARQPGVSLRVVDEVLVRWHIEENRGSVSASRGWEDSLAWGRANRELFTPQAYAAFVLTVVSALAAREAPVKVAARLLEEAYRFGAPRLRHVGIHIGMWTLRPRLRRRLRSLVTGAAR